MSTNLEERVATLEKQLIDLKKIVQGKPVERNWQKTVGMSANDPGFQEMLRLGREYREHDRGDDS